MRKEDDTGVALMNRYSHPHEEWMERLDDVGSEVIITYESGAITIKTDGRRMRVEEYLE